MVFIPSVKSGESEQEYVSRCIPYVMKNEGLNQKQAAGKCYGLYREHKQGKGEHDITITVTETPSGKPRADKDRFMAECLVMQGEKFPMKTRDEMIASCDVEWKKLYPDEEPPGQDGDVRGDYPQKPKPDSTQTPSGDGGSQYHHNRRIHSFDSCHDGIILMNNRNHVFDVKNEDDGSFKAVAVVGDRFYKNKFLSYNEMSKAYKGMDGAFHDIDHHGTTWLDGHPSIEYIIGYQKNTTIDPVSKRMTTDIVIDKNAPKYQAWENYVRNCRNAGRVPNVSISFWASSKNMRAKDLPKNIDYSAYGYDDNDTVEYLYDINFIALSTVMQGACDDKMGCGIGIMSEHDDTKKIINQIKENNMMLFKRLKRIKEEI